MVKTESLAAVRGAPKESSRLNFVAGTAGVHWPPLPESKQNAHPAPTGDAMPRPSRAQSLEGAREKSTRAICGRTSAVSSLLVHCHLWPRTFLTTKKPAPGFESPAVWQKSSELMTPRTSLSSSLPPSS